MLDQMKTPFEDVKGIFSIVFPNSPFAPRMVFLLQLGKAQSGLY